MPIKKFIEKEPSRVRIGKTARVLLHVGTESVSAVMLIMVYAMDSDNLVYLNGEKKRMLVRRFEISVEYLEVGITRMIEKDWVMKIASSTYFVNPNQYVKCGNRQAKKLQNDYSEKKHLLQANSKLKKPQAKKHKEPAPIEPSEEEARIINIKEAQ